MLECCGQPCIYDEIDGMPIVYCPKCGKDWTYASFENEISTLERSRIKREHRGNEIPSIRRDKT